MNAEKLAEIAAGNVKARARVLNAFAALLDLAATKADTTDPRSLDDAQILLRGLGEILGRAYASERAARSQEALAASAEREREAQEARARQAAIMGERPFDATPATPTDAMHDIKPAPAPEPPRPPQPVGEPWKLDAAGEAAAAKTRAYNRAQKAAKGKK